MASKQALAIFTILLALQLSTSQAKEFIVGDDASWTTNFDYQAWAKDKVFHVGDTLGIYCSILLIYLKMFLSDEINNFNIFLLSIKN